MTGADMNNETLEKVRQARAALVRRRPYLAQAILRPVIVSEDLPSETMAVDRDWNMYANPKFVASVSLAELAGVVYHEALHLALDHARRGQMATSRFGQETWTLAAELEINSRILSEGFPLPGDPPTPQKFNLPEGLSAEEYAELLLKGQPKSGQGQAGQKQPKAGQGQEEGSGVDGIPRPWEVGAPLEPVDADAAVRMIAKSILAARHTESPAAGTVPGHLVRWAEAVLNVKTDAVWALVQRFASALSSLGATPTWMRPNRRAAWGDLRVPGHYGRRVHVAVVLDTSASMTDDDVARGVRLVTQLAASAGAEVDVLCVDTEVHSVQRGVTSATKITPVGGGGTDMRVGIEEAARLGPDVIVVFTDGETPWPEKRPAKAVIVALTADNDVPSWAQKVVLK
jgi:predicted metal-dependent peptidase